MPGNAREAIVNIAVAPLISRDQEHIGRLVIFDDITDRSELERRLVQADKLSSIGLLVAGVAHEVNTPLAVISTYAQMLAKQVQGDEQKSRMLEKIAGQTFRASEIVNSLLNFSRTSTTEVAEVNINRVIQETLSVDRSPVEESPHRGEDAARRGGRNQRQLRETAAGLPEPLPERAGCDGRWVGRWKLQPPPTRAGVHIDVVGHGTRHCAGESAPHFRSRSSPPRERKRERVSDFRYHTGSCRNTME